MRPSKKVASYPETIADPPTCKAPIPRRPQREIDPSRKSTHLNQVIETPANFYEYRCACGDTMGLPRLYAGRLIVCPKCAAPVITPKTSGGLASKLDGEMELLTERLSIRIADPGDWKEIYPITSDEDNYHFELSTPDTRALLIKNLKRTRFPTGFRKSRQLQFIARLRGDGQAIGMLHLRIEPSHLTGYIGLMVHHPFHRKGFGTEAVKELVWFGFRKLGLHRIESSCDSENRACIRVLEKNGFAHEGTMQHAVYHPDRGWVDIPSFAQLNPADEPCL